MSILQKQAGRNKIYHFLIKCKFLPPDDKSYITKVRTISGTPDYYSDSDIGEVEDNHVINTCSDTHNLHVLSTHQVSTKQSPHFKEFF